MIRFCICYTEFDIWYTPIAASACFQTKTHALGGPYEQPFQMQEDPPYIAEWDLSIFHWPQCPMTEAWSFVRFFCETRPMDKQSRHWGFGKCFAMLRLLSRWCLKVERSQSCRARRQTSPWPLQKPYSWRCLVWRVSSLYSCWSLSQSPVDTSSAHRALILECRQP